MKEWHCQGAVFTINRSCKALSHQTRILRELLEKQLGIPSIELEGDHTDPTGFEPAKALSAVETLTDIIDSK